MESMKRQPQFPHRLEGEPGADELFDFSERVAVTMLNYMCVLIVQADRATRCLGEQRMKGIIVLLVCMRRCDQARIIGMSQCVQQCSHTFVRHYYALISLFNGESQKIYVEMMTLSRANSSTLCLLLQYCPNSFGLDVWCGHLPCDGFIARPRGVWRM